MVKIEGTIYIRLLVFISIPQGIFCSVASKIFPGRSIAIKPATICLGKKVITISFAVCLTGSEHIHHALFKHDNECRVEKTEEETDTLRELLADEGIFLPIRRKKDEAYLECLIRVIHDDYLVKLRKLNCFKIREKQHIEKLIGNVEKLTDAIIETVETYYRGNIGSAYDLFKAVLDEIDRQLEELGGGSGLFVKASELKKRNRLYRIRHSSERLTERKELFHIPMKQRENVTTQRFSIEGHPSLYLGSSLFISWKESGLPDIWNCYAARFELTDPEYVFLDIRNWLPKFRKRLSANQEDEVDLFCYLCLWPLVAACSVRVKFDDKPFTPEYIIPQFLYQYTSELKATGKSANRSNLKVLGLVYSSTRTEAWENYDPDTEYNLAIPVQQADHENYSEELKDVFPLTRPAFWKNVLDQQDQGERRAATNKKAPEGSAEYYFYHIGQSFSRMEDKLAQEPVAKVDADD